jgi:hypothetical protein
MTWFPEPFDRDETYARRGENTWEWLARSTIPRAADCRRFLNEHIAKLPSESQGRLVHELRYRWQSAFFELVTARILQELGASIALERSLRDGRRPDFTATFEDAAIVIEAKAPVINRAERDEEAARIPLLNYIESRIPRGWLVSVWELPNLKAADSKRDFRREIDELLDLPTPAPNDTEKDLVAVIREGVIHLQVFPSDADIRRLSLEAPIALVANTEQRIRYAVKDKRRQVRNTRMPVILAIQTSADRSDIEDFDMALFGRSYQRLGRHGKRVDTGFIEDGLFNKASAKAPTFAGVLAFLTVGFHSCSAPVLYTHPRCEGVLPAALLKLEHRRYDEALKKVRSEPSQVSTLVERLNLVR